MRIKITTNLFFQKKLSVSYGRRRNCFPQKTFILSFVLSSTLLIHFHCIIYLIFSPIVRLDPLLCNVYIDKQHAVFRPFSRIRYVRKTFAQGYPEKFQPKCYLPQTSSSSKVGRAGGSAAKQFRLGR